MFDRDDARSDDGRDRGDYWDRSFNSRGGTSERDRNDERDPRDVFTKDLDLPRGSERRPVLERDRVYEIDGAESRALATIGAFRVVAESDRHDIRDNSRAAAKPQASRSNRQVFVKSSVDQPANEDTDPVSEASIDSQDDLDSSDWLGVRDDFRNWLTWACGPRNAMKITASE
jgi:hypothetical protein